MDLSVERKFFTSPDLSWLGSRHGVANARPVTLKASAFADKDVKSGQPLADSGDGFHVPFTGGDGEKFAGFCLDAVSVKNGDAAVALLDHGRVIVENLPVEFTAPANAGQFVFV